MTGYRADELTQDYEFKILRSATGAFRRSDRLQQILEEEARCGWTLVEKFDNSRVRLKRLASARDLDGKRGLDAYRTYVGPSPNVLGLAIAATIVGVTLGFILLLGMR